MKRITYYEITKNTDQTEGKGREVGTGICFERHDDAVQFASSDYYEPFAVMGVVNSSYAKYNVKSVEKRVYRSFGEYIDLEGIEQKKRDALAKLTEEEKELLGLT